MCGIFGVISQRYSQIQIKEIASTLFILSESRGREASGFATIDQNTLHIFKSPLPASDLVKSTEFSDQFKKNETGGLIIGHSRLVTNGYEHENINNQPFVKNGITGIHNGIVTNIGQLWEKYKHEIKPETQLDSEIFPSVLDLFLKQGYSMSGAIRKIFSEIEGMTNIALLFTRYNNMLLATNNGSVYYASKNNTFIFASEKLILQKLFKKRNTGFTDDDIIHLKPGYALLLNLNETSINLHDLNDSTKEFTNESLIDVPLRIEEIRSSEDKKTIYINTSLNHDHADVPVEISDHYERCNEKIASLHRCKKCLLPETFPFIEFDENGVCKKCNTYIKQKPLGLDALKETIAPYRKGSGEPDCITAFSGGRDSSYSLHIIKEVLGLTPLAYSYDWGMITDLARRNQSRMCGKLGLEHILISADLRKKRKFIRQNVLAWLKKPHLGTIPLFMAGDKQYFYYASQLQKQYNIPLLIMGENHFEKTGFKIEFTGARQEQKGYMSYHVSAKSKMHMMGFYAKEYLSNPAYLNSSLLNTIGAYFSYYGSEHNYLNLFDYIYWNEEEINSTLLSKYNWETEPGYRSTWRIGDGTTAFYNYIYYIVAGFTENDTFRSNQIREGQISREEGMILANNENKPRFDSIKWYCDTIGIDFNKTIKRINEIKKLY